MARFPLVDWGSTLRKQFAAQIHASHWKYTAPRLMQPLLRMLVTEVLGKNGKGSVTQTVYLKNAVGENDTDSYSA